MEVTVIEEIVGKTCEAIKRDNGKYDLKMEFTDGSSIGFYHCQSCCEDVHIDDIVGDLEDLIGQPLLTAEYVENEDETDKYGLTVWTFYKFATVKGYVDIKWYGASNGYYSVTVDYDVKNA